MLNSTKLRYRYDPTPFKQVFEHEFTYLAGILRNSRRFANDPAIIDPSSGRSWTYAELRRDAGAFERHCREEPMLAAYKRPRAYRFVDAIPLTATGKKRHVEVRQMVRADHAAGALVKP